MSRIDFLQNQHSTVKRNYLQRVMEHDKAACASVAKRFGRDYWDGERKYGYGGYHYDGRWRNLAERLTAHYALKSGERILDVGCGKAFLLYELCQVTPGLEVVGLDISGYGIQNAKSEMRHLLVEGSAEALPFADNAFDCVLSLGTLHNLPLPRAMAAFSELERVGRNGRKYVMVESWRSEAEKANLLYWQLTCESFHDPDSWAWMAQAAGYRGDYGFIFFE